MQIERNIIRDLVEWKDSLHRKPLLLKGVRQCGKTWTLRHFGEKYFANTVEFTFDKDPGLASFFSGAYDARRIISRLSAYCGQKIVPQETLVIFDEIQTCPDALNSLKYFCEDAPEYAIAAAGSLIGLHPQRVPLPPVWGNRHDSAVDNLEEPRLLPLARRYPAVA